MKRYTMFMDRNIVTMLTIYELILDSMWYQLKLQQAFFVGGGTV